MPKKPNPKKMAAQQLRKLGLNESAYQVGEITKSLHQKRLNPKKLAAIQIRQNSNAAAAQSKRNNFNKWYNNATKKNKNGSKNPFNNFSGGATRRRRGRQTRK